MCIYTIERSFQELKLKSEMVEQAIESLKQYNVGMEHTIAIMKENLGYLLDSVRQENAKGTSEERQPSSV